MAEDRVYLAYWTAGVTVLDRAQVEAGADVEPLNPPGSLAPAGLQAHQGVPSGDGQFRFVADEVNFNPPAAQRVVYDIRDLARPREAGTITLDEPLSPPHNLWVAGDRLYVGWYQDGVRVFRYGTDAAGALTIEPVRFKAVRCSRSASGGPEGRSPFDGIGGLRRHACTVAGAARNCLYASDMTYGLITLAEAEAGGSR